MANLICTLCGYSGEVGQKNKGNSLIELILWFFFLVPGLIYSIWRRADRQNICPKCKGIIMIPVNTPVGQKLLYEQMNNPHIKNEPIEKPGRPIVQLVILLACLIALALSAFLYFM